MIAKISNRVKAAIAGLTLSLGAAVVGVGQAFAAYDNASTTAAIGTNIDTLGGNFITNASAALTAVLPYAVGLISIFLAVHLGLRWMKKAAH
ncbi:MAG: hypothetical protein WCX69_04685 [Candidatus Paceibacterota bacterium]